MNKPPDDCFDDNDVAVQIIVELSHLHTDEERWIEILLVCIGKIIFHTYDTYQHEQVINNIAKALKSMMANIKIYEE